MVEIEMDSETIGLRRSQRIKTKKSCNIFAPETPKPSFAIVTSPVPLPMYFPKIEKVEPMEDESSSFLSTSFVVIEKYELPENDLAELVTNEEEISELQIMDVYQSKRQISISDCYFCHGVIVDNEGHMVHVGDNNCTFDNSEKNQEPMTPESLASTIPMSPKILSPASPIDQIEERKNVQNDPVLPQTPRRPVENIRKRKQNCSPESMQGTRKLAKLDSEPQPRKLVFASDSISEKENKGKKELKKKKKKKTAPQCPQYQWKCFKCLLTFPTQKKYMFHCCKLKK